MEEIKKVLEEHPELFKIMKTTNIKTVNGIEKFYPLKVIPSHLLAGVTQGENLLVSFQFLNDFINLIHNALFADGKTYNYLAVQGVRPFIKQMIEDSAEEYGKEPKSSYSLEKLSENERNYYNIIHLFNEGFCEILENILAAFPEEDYMVAAGPDDKNKRKEYGEKVLKHIVEYSQKTYNKLNDDIWKLNHYSA